MWIVFTIATIMIGLGIIGAGISLRQNRRPYLEAISRLEVAEQRFRQQLVDNRSMLLSSPTGRKLLDLYEIGSSDVVDEEKAPLRSTQNKPKTNLNPLKWLAAPVGLLMTAIALLTGSAIATPIREYRTTQSQLQTGRASIVSISYGSLLGGQVRNLVFVIARFPDGLEKHFQLFEADLLTILRERINEIPNPFTRADLLNKLFFVAGHDYLSEIVLNEILDEVNDVEARRLSSAEQAFTAEQKRNLRFSKDRTSSDVDGSPSKALQDAIVKNAGPFV